MPIERGCTHPASFSFILNDAVAERHRRPENGSRSRRTMDSLERFCSRLLNEGRVVFDEPPVAPARDRDGAAAFLSRAFSVERMRIAGTSIAYDPDVAVEAAELVRHACWALVCHDEPAEALGVRLSMRHAPKTAGAHLSADLTLRYLPDVLRRVRALTPTDSLVALLSTTLRQWPLSGVLSDVREPPLSPLDFGGHDGLMLLYAERLAARAKATWVPRGRAGEFAALVFQETGRPLPSPVPEAARDA